MLMTGWFTAKASRKPRPSRSNFKRAWQSAAWNCIRQRPRSSTARTGVAEERIRTSNSTFSDIAFDHDGSRGPGQHTVLWLQPSGQFLGAESHALDDPRLGHPTSNTAVAGRCRPADQSPPAGLD